MAKSDVKNLPTIEKDGFVKSSADWMFDIAVEMALAGYGLSREERTRRSSPK